MRETELGTVVEIDHQLARLLTAGEGRDRFIYFKLAEYPGKLEIDQIVSFERSPHPYRPGFTYATKVRPCDTDTESGRVTYLQSTYGFVRLVSGQDVFFQGWALPEPLRGVGLKNVLSVGQPVTCVHVPDIDGRNYGLRVTPTQGRVPPTRSQPRLGAATRRGTRPNKHFNDDAFLVAPLAEQALWLLAVADGVSRPRDGWWASHKCLELLLQTADAFVPKFLDRGVGKGDLIRQMDAWIREIQKQFLALERGPHREATSTLTFAVVRGRETFWAHCGDSRIFLVPSTGHMEVLTKAQHAGAANKLKQYIGILGAFEPRIGSKEIPSGGMLVFCSDGVVGAPEGVRQYTEKKSFVEHLIGAKQRLQEQVEAALEQIADDGEQDDLTLVVFQP